MFFKFCSSASPPPYEDVEKDSKIFKISNKLDYKSRWKANVTKGLKTIDDENNKCLQELVTKVIKVMDERTLKGKEKTQFFIFKSRSVRQVSRNGLYYNFSLKDFPETFFEWLYKDPERFAEAFAEATSYSIKMKCEPQNLYKIGLDGKSTNEVSEKDVPCVHWSIQV